MNIHSESVLSFPLDKVYQTYRDRLPEIAAYMPDVKEIRVLSRDDVAGGVKIHNRWFASAKLPSVAEKVIKPEWMQWDDYATWDDAQRHVDWHLEIPALGDQVRCSGRNSFWEADGTLVRLTGDLQINLQKLPGMPPSWPSASSRGGALHPPRSAQPAAGQRLPRGAPKQQG